MILIDKVRPYKRELIKVFIRMQKPGISARDRKMTSRQARDYLKKKGIGISRASVINFLNWLVDAQIIDYYEAPGRGGYRRVYTPKLNAEEYENLMRGEVEKVLDEAFPRGWVDE